MDLYFNLILLIRVKVKFLFYLKDIYGSIIYELSIIYDCHYRLLFENIF